MSSVYKGPEQGISGEGLGHQRVTGPWGERGGAVWRGGGGERLDGRLSLAGDVRVSDEGHRGAHLGGGGDGHDGVQTQGGQHIHRAVRVVGMPGGGLAVVVVVVLVLVQVGVFVVVVQGQVVVVVVGVVGVGVSVLVMLVGAVACVIVRFGVVGVHVVEVVGVAGLVGVGVVGVVGLARCVGVGMGVVVDVGVHVRVPLASVC